MLVNIIHYLL